MKHLEELHKLYDREINFEISCFWDAGFRIRLGDRINGFIDEDDSYYDIGEAISALCRMAEKHYPKLGNLTTVAPDWPTACDKCGGKMGPLGTNCFDCGWEPASR